MKGLPASGKSTWAKQIIAKGGSSYKRVNRDDLRKMIDNSQWSKENEKSIVEAEKFLVQKYLEQGKTVIVDDTNLAPQNEAMWKDWAVNLGADFQVRDFTDVPLEECLKRDAERADSVGKKVIMRMYNQFLAPKVEPIKHDPKLPYCYIFDIDGTLALKGDRSPYDWSKVYDDKPNEAIVTILNDLQIVKGSSVEFIIVSGRDAVCEDLTKGWLEKECAFGPEADDEYKLFMRPAGDSRKDVIIKQEIYEREIKGKYNVIAVFDDRDQVVDMWRSLGLTCLQVAPGDF